MGWLLRGAVALVLACGVGASTADGAAAPPPARSVDFARAQAAYAALQHWFTTGDRFVESSVASAKLTTAYAWPASQALAATLGMAAVPGLSTRYRRDVVTGLNALESYRETGALAAYASSVGTSAAPAFYDDNEWIALDLLGAYTLTHETRLLLRARAIFELVVSGWAGDAGACSGGVYWMRSDTNRDRNAVTTENGALLGLQLYALTHEAHWR